MKTRKGVQLMVQTFLTMTKLNISFRMVPSTKETGRIVRDTGTVSKYGLTVHDTKVNGRIIKPLVGEFFTM